MKNNLTAGETAAADRTQTLIFALRSDSSERLTEATKQSRQAKKLREQHKKNLRKAYISAAAQRA